MLGVHCDWRREKEMGWPTAGEDVISIRCSWIPYIARAQSLQLDGFDRNRSIHNAADSGRHEPYSIAHKAIT